MDSIIIFSVLSIACHDFKPFFKHHFAVFVALPELVTGTKKFYFATLNTLKNPQNTYTRMIANCKKLYFFFFFLFISIYLR